MDGIQQKLPPIIGIVLAQVARDRSEGTLNDGAFNEKLSHLERQELEPRELVLHFNELPGRRIRFTIKSSATGEVCRTLEYPADDLGTMIVEMQVALSCDGYYVARAATLEMLWRGQPLDLPEKLRALHRFAASMELWVRSRSRVTLALFEVANHPVVDGQHWERTGEIRLLVNI